MQNWDSGSYGQYYASDYDALFGAKEGLDACARCICDLAAGRPVLEFGIGTGRVALPLADMGVEVHGIEASEEMADLLRAKPGGERIPVTIGDFCETGIDRPFGVVLNLYSTLYLAASQADQVRCFRLVV